MPFDRSQNRPEGHEAGNPRLCRSRTFCAFDDKPPFIVPPPGGCRRHRIEVGSEHFPRIDQIAIAHIYPRDSVGAGEDGFR